VDFGVPGGEPAQVVILVVAPGWTRATLFAEGVLRHLCVERFRSRITAARGLSQALDAIDECCKDRLGEVLKRTGLLTDVEATNKEAALREQMQGLAATGKVSKEQAGELGEELVLRESYGSTGFGKGVAAPRVRHPRLTEFLMPIGRSRQGIEFDSLDRKPAHIVVSMLAPENAEEEKEVLEATLLACLAQETFRSRVMSARGLSDVLRAVADM
jgi:mannitol/fructose-specific phosphotransferase system IIA component (Ntr-type)